MNGQTPEQRLDSWKAIADYLQRSEATVRRWESIGLPVHRVPGGRGKSVFAYPSEVDQWLRAASFAEDGVAAAAPARFVRFAWLVPAALVVGIVAAVATRSAGRHLDPLTLKLDVGSDAIVAYGGNGERQWRYAFDAGYMTVFSETAASWQVTRGPHPEIYVATSHRVRAGDNHIDGGELIAFDLDGRRRHVFSFDDTVSFAKARYGGPWGITAFAVQDATASPLIAVAAHHWAWDPSLVAILDAQWRRRATFVHAGWIESLNWLAPDRLLLAGYSEAHNGGLVALLDPSAANGQGPEPQGTRYHCDDCPPAAGVRMIVMPRTELNRVTASRFNRAHVQVVGDRIFARTIEVVASQTDVVDVLYEFTPDLKLISAKFSDRYWELHRALEAQGKIAHTREQCPDRDGPREILVWTPDAGWRTQKTR